VEGIGTTTVIAAGALGAVAVAMNFARLRARKLAAG
jgi:hypothetical protein